MIRFVEAHLLAVRAVGTLVLMLWLAFFVWYWTCPLWWYFFDSFCLTGKNLKLKHYQAFGLC